MERTWTITELADRAVAALSADGSPRANGRVRDLPNERLIRWYTTIGLVDPPLGRRGRTALYGHRHLLQLVAIKRRQAAGRSIAEIQTELTGAPDATLEEIAQLPAPLDEPGNGPLPAAATPTRGRFWTTPPSSAVTSEAAATFDGSPTPYDPPAGRQEAAQSEGASESAQIVQGVRLGPDLTLLLNVPSLDEADLAAIETAARPLLDELRRRGLIGEDTHPQSAATPGRSS
ncbi:MerR family transcriptional regulator [Actinomadura rudentiformis]|uniref:MerR family transcriptional regulator n=1 Tax=Actinomadura rudentiformis TaxID=359158 RepID=A0A6H9YRS1_9ACTN|nr:MerR family transcriptional regulator [Actinomadura rudentiformis]KAB2350832.1 MerR family transcriptional regulator [Actinomadura rudentiformis]